jgi:hypothetical protein
MLAAIAVAGSAAAARGRFHKALEPGTYVFALQRAPAPAAAKRVVVPPHRFVPVILRRRAEGDSAAKPPRFLSIRKTSGEFPADRQCLHF